MKSSIVFCVIFLATLALARPGQYTDKFDNTDIQEVMSNPKLIKNYVDCMMERGPCTAEGKELKMHIKEALETKCEKCTDTQKKSSETVIKHMVNHEPAYWDELCSKYDPDKKYATMYEKELRDIKA